MQGEEKEEEEEEEEEAQVCLVVVVGVWVVFGASWLVWDGLSLLGCL